MTLNAFIQCALYLLLLVGLGIPLGAYMARVYEGRSAIGNRVFGPLERLVYRIARVSPDEDMGWKRYAGAVLVFNLLGALVVYALQRVQGFAAHESRGNAGGCPRGRLQHRGQLCHQHQLAGVRRRNDHELPHPDGGAHGAELRVGGDRHGGAGGADPRVRAAQRQRHRVVLGGPHAQHAPHPAAALRRARVAACFAGRRADLRPLRRGDLLDPVATSDTTSVATQTIAVGPAASQIAIKQLGTNGGGFFNVNSAHPLENATPFSNLLEVLAILLIPGALCFTFGEMVKDRRQGWALLAAMLIVFVPLLFMAVAAEQAGNPALATAGIDAAAGPLQSGGNMEGKEVRFGIANSALWATATTAASNGSVNAMHDSFTPLGGLVPMCLMQLGEIIFGGVGSGLYGILMFAVVAVFIAGLMVGRTPEYLGKKIEAFEMKMASLAVLVPLAAVLLGTAAACLAPETGKAILNPGSHGFSEILYAFSSSSNNNGSAFAGLTASGMFYATAQGITMLVGRYWVIIPVLAAAGSLARKKYVPPSAGTLPTHTPLFVLLLVGVIVVIGALTFFPALSLGPIVEHLQLVAGQP